MSSVRKQLATAKATAPTKIKKLYSPMIKIIAGIGSRETPPEILVEMKKIGAWCKHNNIIVRSGHADGADWAFEQGAQSLCEVYLPWKGFNKELKSAAKMIVHVADDAALRSIYMYHPYPKNLSGPVQKIMARNWAQVMGHDSKTPCDAVVAWTKDGKEDGGTGQALRIAKAKKIRIINMYEHYTVDRVIAQLIKI
jgi:hypothetical protein